MGKRDGKGKGRRRTLREDLVIWARKAESPKVREFLRAVAKGDPPPCRRPRARERAREDDKSGRQGKVDGV